MYNFHDVVQILKLSKASLVQKTIVLPSSAWAGEDTPYIQNIDVEGVTPDNIVFVAADTDLDNLDIASQCKIIATNQDLGRLTFAALKDKPDEDIVINLLIGGDGKPII